MIILILALIACPTPLTGNVEVLYDDRFEAAWLQMNRYGIEAPQENATSYPGPGQLLYYPGGVSEKEMLIPYGSAIFAGKFGLLPGNHFATIIEGNDFLEKMGEKVLWEGSKKISIESY